MIFKLSIRNAIRSFRDYLIYFLTLVLVVSLYYVFASIEFQPFIQSLSPEALNEVLGLLQRIGYIMLFIVSGFVLYANNFLLKRRSKELGIYMTVGISSIKINFMLFLEAIVIGAMSIVAGIVLGVFLSTLIGLLIIRMLGLLESSTPFIFNMSAAYNTAYVFIIIFLGSSLLNYLRIARLKAINLLNSFGKKKTVKKSNNLVSVLAIISFATSVSLLIYSYYIFIKFGIDFGVPKILNAVYLLAIGFIGFIASGAYLLSYIVNKNERIIYKDINLFTYKKITDKIMQNGLVIGTIAAIMSVTLVVVGIGFSYNSWLNESLLAKAPYSISVSELGINESLEDYLPYLENKGYEIKNAYEFNVYKTELLKNSVTDNSLINRFEDSIDLVTSLSFIKLSTYNKLREIAGEKPIALGSSEVAINTSNIYWDAVYSFLSRNKTITVNGLRLTTSTNRLFNAKISDTFYATGGDINLVVNDDFKIDKHQETAKSFIINTKVRVNTKDSGEFRDYMFSKTGGFLMVSQAETIDFNLKHATYVIISSLFLGFILMIIGMSILSLHQMTEAIENRKSYDILSKLGVSSFGLRISVLKQILGYFFAPLIVAIPNFIVGMVIVAKWFGIAGAFSISTALVTTIGIILAIYMFFIMITYNSCANILELS